VAQMILGSPQLLLKFQNSILLKLEALLRDILKWNPSEIGQLECEENVTWGSFAPLMYLYEPCIHFNETEDLNKPMEELYHFSIDTLLHSLQSTVWRKEHVEVLIEEELLDFVVMAPWFMPSNSQERASRVVHQLTKVQSLQPPSLSIICKAKVAKMKLGLIGVTDKVKSLSQIYSELL